MYMAIDQYGTTYHGLEKPRRDLIKKTGYQHVSKMLVDSTDGKVYQTGYVIGPLWCNVYEVKPMWLQA